MVKIAVTGGSGFIGSNYISYLLENQENRVLNIDWRPSVIPAVQEITRIVDINDSELLERTLTDFQPDYIVHLAARTDLNGTSLNDYATNIGGVQNLMKAVGQLPDLKKIVIASSMLVCHVGYQPQHPFDYCPTTCYGKSKVETEKIVWANRPACDWAIIRPTSIWGPWFGEPYRNFFDMVIAHRYFHIGNKGCTKTYGFIGNAVYQIDRILNSDTSNEDKKVFYIGDHPPIPIEEWANEIAGELGYTITKVPFWLIKVAAYGGDVLKRLGVRFPMTSFRLKNMTTDHIIDLTDTYDLAPNPPCNRLEGVRKTLEWMKHCP